MVLIISISVGIISSCGETDTGIPAEDTGISQPSSNQEFVLADSASESVDACSYSFRLYGTGAYSFTPLFFGNIAGRAYGEDGGILLFAEMGLDSTPEIEDETELSLTLVSGPDSAYMYDALDGVFRKGSLEDGGGDLLRTADYAVMSEYFINEPFVDEIESQSVMTEGINSIGDVACETFLVTYISGQQTRWSLGINDHLPRYVERIMTDQEGNPASIVLEIYDLDISPVLPDSIFRLVPPEGVEVEIYSAFLKIGTKAPLWSLSDSEGDIVSLEGLKGNVVVIDFWATWCGPCRVVMPEIQSLHVSYTDQPVRVFGVNVWEMGDPVSFMDENGYTYCLLLEGDNAAEDYKVSGIPTLYVIDQEGSIAFAQVGTSPDLGLKLTEVIDSLLVAE